MALFHHSFDKVAADELNGPQTQKTDRAETRPGVLKDPGPPWVEAVTVGYVAARAPPSPSSWPRTSSRRRRRRRRRGEGERSEVEHEASMVPSVTELALASRPRTSMRPAALDAEGAEAEEEEEKLALLAP